ncbi:MAG: preprotein translocase subunit SecA [Candidatus Cloacimonetes bacterium]|nr:preprotein translocase subunit SecA [Candidatus Cloacimonadota bacterium]
MLNKLVQKLFGDQHGRQLKKLEPFVDEIKQCEKTIATLSDDDLRDRVKAIRAEIHDSLDSLYTELEVIEREYHAEADENRKERIGDRIDTHKEEVKTHTQATLDEHLPEVFAIVRETCRRLVGASFEVRGTAETWHMVPFDVQLIGGVALHQGAIAEMATGEGKTLAATLPLFLNALLGRGCHLITVNDYLASRDSEWMSPIFAFHGMTVGCITTGMPPEERHAAYRCDVTYGINSEFGFDYLRDNMAVSAQQIVQHDHCFAIVDEVDSVLIDEARTPLIISGPVPESKNFYREIKPQVKKLVNAQSVMLNRVVSEARRLYESDEADADELGRKLLTIKRGAPHNKQFMKLMKEAELKKLVSDYEGALIRDKKLHLLDEELFYSIDEHARSADLNEKGCDMLSKYDTDLFIVDTLDELLQRVDDAGHTHEEATKLKERETQRFMDKSERLHNISQLLKSYALFESEVDYIVQDNKVIIVDGFTGRPMPGRRFSDGLHQALEAKEGVTIEQANQTLATITLQNFFRMYDKLAGMTGTAVTEEGEFAEIYKLPVMVIPTNAPITRIDYDDMIYLTKLEKYRAIIDEIAWWHELGKPVLVGTVSVEVSETLARLLRRRGIPHNVLNAKYHEQEAEIIKNAGAPGAVTIATNMAGRGTDIKLGRGVVAAEQETYRAMSKSINEETPHGIPLDGLHVIGTERHESRRIDRQLRGRSGRQGDPGTSRFYLSLEDNLMRLFGSDRIAGMMKKLGVKENDAITHPWMTGAVEKAQKRVEGHNFEIRKRLLQYDEVMNQQREVIYKFRRNVLKGYDLRIEILDMVKDTIANVVADNIGDSDFEEEFQVERVLQWFRHNLSVNIPESAIQGEGLNVADITDQIEALLLKAYERKEEAVGEETMREIERRALLTVVDENWRDHLHELDLLKEAIGLRAYANKDPLIEFKRESFELFQRLIAAIYEQVTKKVYTTYIISRDMTREQVEQMLRNSSLRHEDISAFTGDAPQPASGEAMQQPRHPAPAPKKLRPRHVDEKVGRNDPCPCGSGRKYKRCCGKISD